LVCKICNHSWTTTVQVHVKLAGCPSCAEVERWTFDKFLKVARATHGDHFSYEHVQPNDIQSQASLVNVICKKCNRQFEVTVKNHIINRSGCRKCHISHG